MVECNNPATVPVPAHPLPPMPHDPEAEWSIIGMFLYLEVNSSNISRFDPDNDFYDFKAAAVMNIIRDLDESGQQPSYSNVYSCLLKKFEHEATDCAFRRLSHFDCRRGEEVGIYETLRFLCSRWVVSVYIVC